MAVAKRKWGQHWLASDALAQSLVRLVELDADHQVLEIGPGTGRLTRALLATGAHVVAVEVDPDRARDLARNAASERLVVINDDITASEAAISWARAPFRLIGNLPYNMTGAILQWTGQRIDRFVDAHFMVQAEVAERIVAEPGTKAYGALSVRVQWSFVPSQLRGLPPAAFRPQPRVDSAFVRLTPRASAAPSHAAQRALALGFSQRRKQLVNSLAAGPWSVDEVRSALRAIEIADTRRAETLSPEQWLELGRVLGGPAP